MLDKQITQLVDDKESGFCTKSILESIVPAWEAYSYLSLYPIDNNTSSYDYFRQLTQNGHVCCFMTGNETEAWRHILLKKPGNILLVTDDGSYFFAENSFSHLSEQYDRIEAFTYRDIHDDGSSGKCETATIEKSFLFFHKNHTIQYTGVVNSDGAEGIIYKTNEPQIAVKAFCQSVSDQKIKKLESLIAFQEKKENFAWPIEFVYSSDHTYTDPIGFTMPFFNAIRPLEELQYLDVVTDRHRWKVAVSFLAQVLYLYLHGIQIGDYNANNFYITDECKVVLMDMDSYVYNKYGTQVHGRQPLSFSPDYTRRSSIIEADYLLLNCMVFQILADGLWPYFYDEDLGQTVCRMSIKGETDFQNVISKFPVNLKVYYKKLFEKGIWMDPFELLFVLLDAENYFLSD